MLDSQCAICEKNASKELMHPYSIRKIINLKLPEFIKLITKQHYSRKYQDNGKYKYDHKDIVRVFPEPG